MRTIHAVLAPLALAATLQAQTVWTVDADLGPGADFASIWSAVDAASDGDVILVRDGMYRHFWINDKGVTIQAEEGHQPIVGSNAGIPIPGYLGTSPVVWVRNLAPGKEVYIRGLQILTTYSNITNSGTLRINDNQGDVWIEDCRVEISDLGTTPPGAMVLVEDNAGVHFGRCFIEQAVHVGREGHALESFRTNLTIWDSILIGGQGTGITGKEEGGDGLLLHGGELFAMGSIFRGGQGLDGPAFEDFGGDGGNGLTVEAGALARTRDCTFEAGPLGVGALSSGVDGLPTSVSGGTLQTVPGTARSFALSAVVRAGIDPIDQTYVGEPGDLVYLLWSYTGQIPGLYLAIEKGSFVIDITTLDGVAVGAVPASGQLDVSFPPIAIGALDTFSFACQASFLEFGEGFFISGPSLLTVVGPAF